MGLFSGGFLGSGSDESKTNTTTNVTTNTTTNVRDIGLTGEGAVGLANVVTGNLGNTTANLYREQQQGFSALISGLTGGFSDLIKGFSQVVTTTQQTSENMFSKNVGTLDRLGQIAQAETSQILSTAQAATNPALSLAQGSQQIILVAIAAVALVFLSRS